MPIVDVRNKVIESIAMGLVQARHLRFHKKDELGPKTMKILDKHIPILQKLIEDLSIQDMAK